MRRYRRFTLIELLIGLGIFAVLSMLAYGGLQAALTSGTRAGVHLERLGQMQRTIGRLGSDIEQAVDRPVRDRYGVRLVALLAGTDEPVLLELTHGGLANPADLPRSSLQRVRYRLDGKKFVREQWSHLDRSPGTKPSRQLLIDAVESVAFRFLLPDGSWTNQWPASGNTGLPSGIEVTLVIEGVGKIRRIWVTRG